MDAMTASIEEEPVVTSEPEAGATDVVADAPVGEGAPERTPDERTFHQLLLNTLVSGVTSSFLWFALTFWVYLETRSVVVTGVIAGAFSISSAVLGPAFGTYIDRHRKQPSMV